MRPLGLDNKPYKVIIQQRWRPEKGRMDYHTTCNTTTGSGTHLKGYSELCHFMTKSLAKDYVVEIVPDYDRKFDEMF